MMTGDQNLKAYNSASTLILCIHKMRLLCRHHHWHHLLKLASGQHMFPLFTHSFQFPYVKDHCWLIQSHFHHLHLGDNLTMRILQLQQLFSHIHVYFLDTVVPLHCLLDCLDLVHPIMTEWMLRLQKHHMLDSIYFAKYLSIFLK